MYYLPSCLSKVTLFVTCYVVGYATHDWSKDIISHTSVHKCLGCSVRSVYSILFHPGFTTSYKNLPAENELRSKFSVPPVYDHLQYMLCKGNCASYNLIGAVEFNSDLTPCDKKSFSEHQTFFARVRGSGYETIVVVLP